MGDEWVIDASVAAKIVFTEEGSDRAREALAAASRLIAPDLLLLEIASVTRTYVRRGETDLKYATAVPLTVEEFIDEWAALRPLTPRALDIAIASGASVYDAIYLALAEQTGTRVLTADARLVRLCADQGFGDLVRAL